MYAHVLHVNVSWHRDTRLWSPSTARGTCLAFRICNYVSLGMITDLLECDGYDAYWYSSECLIKRTIVEPIMKTITTEQLATKDMHRDVFRDFGLPRKLIADREPRL
jgi:hypothetical protein